MWRTFFDAVIMTEVKWRPLHLLEVSLALPRSKCDGSGDSRGVCCACASRSRNRKTVSPSSLNFATGSGEVLGGSRPGLYIPGIGPAVVLYPAICACLLLWFPQPKRIAREEKIVHLIPSASTTSVRRWLTR
jgi:hypothetical protein